MIKKYAAVVTLSLSAALTVSAVDYNYAGSSPATGADWENTANWASGVAPSSSGNDWYYFGNNLTRGTLTVSSSLETFSRLGIVNAGTMIVDDGAYIRLSTDGVTVDGELQVNNNNSAIIQNGGTISVGYFRLNVNSSGYYYMNGGLLENTGGGRLQNGGGNSVFTQTGGTVRFAGGLEMGVDNGNSAIYNQSGGLAQFSGVSMGMNGNVTDGHIAVIYTLSDSGTLLVTGNMLVGPTGDKVKNSVFTQSGSTYFQANNLQVGQGSNFTANATTGTKAYASIGYYTLTDSATAVIANTIEFGRYGATGIGTISGGVLTGSANVTMGGGYNGFNGVIDGGTNRYYTRAAGYITQTGGTFAVNSKNNDVYIYVGYNGGDGAYDLSSGELKVTAPANAYMRLGDGVAAISEAALPLFVNTSGSDFVAVPSGTYFAASSGRFVQTGGTVTLSAPTNADLQIGYNGGNGSYELSGGELTAKRLILASGASSVANGAIPGSGTFTISGGSLTLTSVEVANYTNGVADAPQRVVGRFVQDGGSVTVSGAVQIGLHGGDGAWTMNSGALAVGGQLIVGMHGSVVQEAQGILPADSFTINGGVATVGGNIELGYYNETNSASVLGILNVNGGELTGNVLRIANQLMGHGQANLNGGKLAVNQIFVNQANDPGSGILFNGGTLAARRAEGNFLFNFAAGTVVTESVGTIDNSGYNIAIHSGISGSGGMVFSGSGETLTYGVNTYTGTTKVAGNGVLILAGSSTLASRDFIVEAGSVLNINNMTGGLVADSLSGAGTILGRMKFAGAQTFTPGDNGVIGTLTLDNTLTVSAGSEFNFLLGDTSNVNSMLRLTGGTFDYTGAANGLTVNFSTLSALAEGDYTYALIAANGLSLSNFILGAYDQSIYDNALLDVISNQLVLTFSVIPEPSALALTVIGGALLLILRRRR